MNTLSRQELILRSISVFAAHAVSTLFATADGQFFIHEDRAKLHKSSIKSNKVYEIDLDEAKEAAKLLDKEAAKDENQKQSEILALHANPAIDAINALDNLKKLAALKVEESKNKIRSTVLKAIEDRIAALNVIKEAGNANTQKDTETNSGLED